MSESEIRELIDEARALATAAAQATACSILSMRAERCFEQGRPREAAELLRALLEIAPPDADGLDDTARVVQRIDAYAAGRVA